MTLLELFATAATLIATCVFRPDADAKDIALDVVVPPTLPRFVGDAGRLQQVFWNLLSNAIKFTPRGGRIGIRVAEDAGHLAVQVTDTVQGRCAGVPSIGLRSLQERALVDGAVGVVVTPTEHRR